MVRVGMETIIVIRVTDNTMHMKQILVSLITIMRVIIEEASREKKINSI
jgi:hypothetical protein